ncbi:MAG: tetratricopeptide repeat protein [Planctomycetota bacterium]
MGTKPPNPPTETPHRLRARMLGLLGRLFIERSDFVMSLGILRDRFTLCNQIKDWDGAADSLLWMGHAYRLLNENNRASDRYRKALALSRQHHLRERIGESLNHIGMSYYFQRELDKALEYFLASANELRDNGASILLGQTLMHIGNIYRKVEEAKKAEKYYSEAVKVSKGVGDEYNLGMTLANRALLSFSLDDENGGKAYIREAFERLRFAGALPEIHLFKASLQTLYGIKKLN